MDEITVTIRQRNGDTGIAVTRLPYSHKRMDDCAPKFPYCYRQRGSAYERVTDKRFQALGMELERVLVAKPQ